MLDIEAAKLRFPSRPSPRRNALWVVAVSVVYFAGAWVSRRFAFEPEGIAAVWPASGLFLSALLLTRRNVQPWLALSLLITDFGRELLIGLPPAVSALYALALTGDAVTSVFLLRRVVGESVSFRRVRDVVAWLVLSVLFSNMTWSLMAAAAATALLPGPHSFFTQWVWLAAPDGVGNVLVTPFLLTWAAWIRAPRAEREPARVPEWMALALGTILVSVVLFRLLSEHEPWLPSLTFPFLLWAALRFEARGAATVPVLMAAIGVPLLFTHPESAGQLTPDVLGNVVVLQVLVATTAVPGLILAALVAEQREGEARYRAITKSATDAIVTSDSAGGVVGWNPGAERMFGYAEGEILGLPVTRLMPQASVASHRAGLRRAADGGGAGPIGQTVERRGLHKDGHEFPLEISLARWEGDGQWFYTGILRDVSERKKAEAAAAAMQAQFAHAEKMEAVGRLAGGIAHDVNNMLSVIVGGADLAMRSLDPATPVYVELSEIRRAALRAAAIKRQLLAFSREQPSEAVVLNVNELVKDALHLLEKLLGDNMPVAWQPAAHLWPVLMDAAQLDQVLVNLCINARDATDDTGPVTIATANCTLDAAFCATHVAAEPGEYVRLSVSDRGRGMDELTLARVFEPFFTTKADDEGTGLGLATSYAVVARHHGFITVTSRLGEGTTFDVYLPRHHGAPSAARVAEEAPLLARGHETILLVEVEPMVLSVASRALEAQGYQVLGAGSPAAAIRLANEHTGGIHLLLTAVIMPGMSGPTLAQAVLPLHPRMKCLYMSGFSDRVTARHVARAGNTPFLAKPFTVGALAAKVREVLDQA